MDRFSALNVGRLESVAGVGQSQTGKAPGLAAFLAQRANQVLGVQRTEQPALPTPAPEADTSPSAAQDSTLINAQLARQMEQLQRLSSSISSPSNAQGISVVV
jgi:hypothetical protein